MWGRYALPMENSFNMPRHHVNEPRKPSRYAFEKKHTVTTMARLFVCLCTLTLSYYGAKEMYAVLNTNHITKLQWLFLILFCLNFTWISFAFSQATLGFLYRICPFHFRKREVETDKITAILLPIYNEDPFAIRARVEAMREDIIEKAPGKFAFFILSDSNKSASCIKEKHVLHSLLYEEDSRCPIFYRNRSCNTERKAGNIADWVTKFGASYEYMIILDADSLMGANCLLSLSRRMAAEPGLGLIQTLPTIIRANTLYSRVQQFANQCFGPIYAAGLAAWHGNSSNFWGHNAIIRTQAFAESCGLPILPGKAPFGGHIMSHDFAEAAMLRRAGWGVRFDTDLTESYEEAPPSLLDVMIRDRRWCQGNLQHKSLVIAQGLHFATRLHLLSGILSYLTAVFWFLLIAVGFALAVQAYFVRPEYFANPSLFPTWPVFDVVKARQLFTLSIMLVITPKIYGWLAIMLHWKRCVRFGGPILLTLNTLLEILLSALYAPVLMLSQFFIVFDVIKGRDSGWHPQARQDGATSWKEATHAYALHTLLGCTLAASSFFLNTQLFYWSLPISFSLIFSIPLSWMSGGRKRGNVLSKLWLLKSPEEKRPTDVIEKFHRRDATHHSKHAESVTLKALFNNQPLYLWSLAQLTENPSIDHTDRDYICAEWKIQHTSTIEQLESLLEEGEKLAILRHKTLMQALEKYREKEETTPKKTHDVTKREKHDLMLNLNTL